MKTTKNERAPSITTTSDSDKCRICHGSGRIGGGRRPELPCPACGGSGSRSEFAGEARESEGEGESDGADKGDGEAASAAADGLEGIEGSGAAPAEFRLDMELPPEGVSPGLAHALKGALANFNGADGAPAANGGVVEGKEDGEALARERKPTVAAGAVAAGASGSSDMTGEGGGANGALEEERFTTPPTRLKAKGALKP